MSSNQHQPVPPLVPIGGQINLMGHLFTVVAHTTDARGNTVEVPGACLGRASKEQIATQSKRSRPTVASASNLTTASAPTTVPAPPLTSAVTQLTAAQSVVPAMPCRRKAKRYKASPRGRNGGYQRFKPKPPPLKIVYEPTSAAAIWGWVVAIALVVAGIWLWNSGSEQAKWKTIEGAAKAGQRR